MNLQNISLTPFLVLLIQALLAWVLWSMRHVFVREEDYAEHIEQSSQVREEVNLRVNGLEGRLITLEERVNTLPDIHSLNGLAKAVESLRGDLKTLDMRITGVDRLMQRLERALERQELMSCSKHTSM